MRGRLLRFADYGEGPPVVLVHGLGGSWQTWLENIPVLGASNRVIAVDLPGFGQSEMLPAGSPLDAYGDALATLFDRLELAGVALVGHSLGGLITGRFAVAHPERLRALVLVGAGGIAVSPRRLAAIVRGFVVFNAVFRRPAVQRAVARRPRLRRLVLAGMMHDTERLSPELAAEVMPLMAADGFVEAVVAGGAVAGDSGVERVTTRTLLVWGRHDLILPVRSAEELAAKLRDGRLEVIEDAGHAPMIERPEEFNELVEGFLADHLRVPLTRDRPTAAG